MKLTHIDKKLYKYILDVSVRETEIQRALREETARLPLAIMQISPEQGQFMRWLINLTQAKKILEIGTFTGYSALSMAMALPDDGKLITCDINPTWRDIAERYWHQAQQAHKIELHIGPALESMYSLLNDGYQEQFDFIFIDADKTRYVDYYELALRLLAPRGIIAIDNVLWDGKVVDETITDRQTEEIRRLNAIIKQDDRVDVSLLSIGDGLFLVTKKGLL